MKRATAILKQELPKKLQADLVPPPSPGHATFVIVGYESGVRGVGLDYSVKEPIFTPLTCGSSSCSLDHAKIVADGDGSKVEYVFPTTIFAQWATDTDDPDWPHRPCVRVSKRGETVDYFDQPVHLEPQQFQILVFYVECAHRRPGAVGDVRLREHVSIADGADLAPILSRLRAAFRDASKQCRNALVGSAASRLVDTLLPGKQPGIGYRVGRPELFRFV